MVSASHKSFTHKMIKKEQDIPQNPLSSICRVTACEINHTEINPAVAFRTGGFSWSRPFNNWVKYFLYRRIYPMTHSHSLDQSEDLWNRYNLLRLFFFKRLWCLVKLLHYPVKCLNKKNNRFASNCRKRLIRCFNLTCTDKRPLPLEKYFAEHHDESGKNASTVTDPCQILPTDLSLKVFLKDYV